MKPVPRYERLIETLKSNKDQAYADRKYDILTSFDTEIDKAKALLQAVIDTCNHDFVYIGKCGPYEEYVCKNCGYETDRPYRKKVRK